MEACQIVRGDVEKWNEMLRSTCELKWWNAERSLTDGVCRKRCQNLLPNQFKVIYRPRVEEDRRRKKYIKHSLDWRRVVKVQRKTRTLCMMSRFINMEGERIRQTSCCRATQHDGNVGGIWKQSRTAFEGERGSKPSNGEGGRQSEREEGRREHLNDNLSD